MKQIDEQTILRIKDMLLKSIPTKYTVQDCVETINQLNNLKDVSNQRIAGDSSD